MVVENKPMVSRFGAAQSPRVTTPRFQAPAPSFGPQEDTVHFAGSSRKKTLRRALAPFVLALGLSPALLAGTAASAQAAPGGTNQYGAACVIESADIPAGQEVNTPGDIPQVNASMTQTTVDVKGDCLLSADARQYIEQKLQRFYDDGLGEFKVVIIPQTATDDLQSFGDDLAQNQLHLGSKEYNDGLLAVINAQKFRAKQQGLMSIIPGDYYYDQFNNNQQLHDDIGQNALSYLDQAIAARKAGNLAEAQRYTDKAAEAAVDTFVEYATQYHHDHPPLTAAEKAQQKAEHDAQAKADYERHKKELELFLLLLGVGLGTGTGGVLYARKRKRLNEAVAAVKTPLIEMGSPYLVTRKNVFSMDTLKALLNDDSDKKADPQDLIDSIDVVLGGMKTEDPKVYNEVVKVFVEEGLVHSQPEIRQNTVNRMINDGLTREDFEPFMTLLATETDQGIINSLMEPVSTLTTEDEVPGFKEKLKNSEQPGIRSISVAVLEKFADKDTLQDFYTALEKEEEGSVIDVLQKGVAKVAVKESPIGNQDDLLFTNLDTGKAEKVRTASLMALTAEAKPEFFEKIHAIFKDDNAKSLQPYYKDALLSSVTENNLDTIYEGLKEQTERRQGMSVALLGKLQTPKALEPLMDYLATEDTKFADEAGNVVVNSVTAEQNDALLEIIHSEDPRSNDIDVMTTAVKALDRLGLSENLDDLMEALERKQVPQVTQLLIQAIEDAPEDARSFDYLKKVLSTTDNVNARIASIIALDDYGQDALEPLFDALEKTDGNTSQGEVDALRKGLMKIGRDDSLWKYMAQKSESNHDQVSDVGTRITVSIIDGWTQRYDYDDDQVMDNLDKLTQLGSSTVNNEAQQAINSMIREKRSDLARIGSSGSIHDYSNWSTLQRYLGDPNMSGTASAAISQLDARKAAWEEAERRRREEEARQAAAAAAAARAAAASSSSSSGFSSGGGSFSSGGGTSW